MYFLKREEGLAMPLVLMVLIVLTLLSTALWQYSMSELNQSIRDEKKSRAHYLARAGAEAVALDLMWNPEKLDGLGLDTGYIIETDPEEYLISYNDINGEAVDEIVGEIEVKVHRISEYSVDITGIGTVEDIVQEITVRIEALESFDGVMYSQNSFIFNQKIISDKKITGDIVTGGELYYGNINTPLEEHPVDGYSLFTGRNMIFPEIKYDGGPAIYDDDLFEVNGVELIDSNVGYKKIDIKQGGTLTIKDNPTVHAIDLAMDNHGKLILDVNNDNSLDNALKLVIENDLDLKDLNVTGSGLAIIYVNSGEVNVQTSHASIIGEGAYLLLVLGDGVVMDMQAKSYFQGLVYGPGATVKMQGNTSFTGSMIVRQVQGKNNIEINADKIHKDYDWAILEDMFGRYHMIQWIQ